MSPVSFASGKWMPGSDHLRRTKREQDTFPAETAGADTLVQIAIVYRGQRIVYRHGCGQTALGNHAVGLYRQSQLAACAILY